MEKNPNKPDDSFKSADTYRELAKEAAKGTARGASKAARWAGRKVADKISDEVNRRQESKQSLREYQEQQAAQSERKSAKEQALSEVLSRPQNPNFNVRDWVAERKQKTGSVLVEFGHGKMPLAAREDIHFRGEDIYIGVESWDNPAELAGHQIVPETQAAKPDENIVFMPREGIETHIPDGTVDEVVFSNVFGDPDTDRPGALLDEARRIMSDQGKVIIREDRTPSFAENITRETTLAQFGFRVDAKIEKGQNSEEWMLLEDGFSPKPDLLALRHDNSFAMVLSKMNEEDFEKVR